MLESQWLKIRPPNHVDLYGLAQCLGIPAQHDTLNELRGRMRRLDRIHALLRRRRTSPDSLRSFIHVAKQPCKLTLARYLFEPSDVARWIEESVLTSRGMHYLHANDSELSPLRDRCWRAIPEYERAIMEALTCDGRIYWVGPQTSSRINQLVEYPMGTVALVIKPPGSDLEFEIKRAGLRGARPVIGRVRKRWEGSAVVPSPARRIFRTRSELGIPGRPPPRRVVSRHSRRPAADKRGAANVGRLLGAGRRGDTNVISWFSNPDLFGEGFETMRAEMANSVDAFEADHPDTLLVGDVGLTVRFFKHLLPVQGIVAGTSSFRLERLARDFSLRGTDLYFGSTPSTFGDVRRFADDLLEEILGVYVPPGQSAASLEAYVRAALRVPANRLRADRTYIP